MAQVTLIALYREKPTELSDAIYACREYITKILGGNFRLYDMRQIHGTIVGLEREENQPTFINRNLAKYRNRLDSMDFEGLLNFIRGGAGFPFQVQIGGF